MKMNQKLSHKTRLLNVVRRILTKPLIENFLIKRTANHLDNFWVRLSPPPYLYAKNSTRNVVRNGIHYSLDISDAMEHAVYYGFREKAHDELFRIAVGKRVFVDVGANLGVITLNFAKLCPDAEIYSFEPDSKNYEKARKNIALNALSNIKLIKQGLGEAPAKVKLFAVDPINEGMNRILDIAEDKNVSKYRSEEIELESLDGFRRKHNIGRIDLIKIDVEGYELKVLKGANEILKSDMPTLFVEIVDRNLRAQNGSSIELVKFLTDLGYRIYRADSHEAVTVDSELTDSHFDIIAHTSRSD